MKIEIWSDIACPWCYIGKHRLEDALTKFDGQPDIVWRSFQLDPSAARKPDKPLVDGLAQKYGVDRSRAGQMVDQMTQTAAQEDLDIDLRAAKGGNTLDAHRLVHLARTKGLQPEMIERLFRAYMSEGVLISDRDELGRLADEVGLDKADVDALLAGDQFKDKVRRDQAEGRQFGVTGVPYFLVDKTHGVSGAQPADTLVDLFERVRGAADSKPAD